MGKVRARFVVTCCALVCAACAGNGDGLDQNGRPVGDGQATAPLSASFQSIQDNVFTPICTTCHAGANAPQGLRLDAANSYNLLVGVPSTEDPGTLRVQAGDPDHSYLIEKLEGRAAVGAQMPLGGPPLPASTIAFIRQWISDGASKTATASSVSPAKTDISAEKRLALSVVTTAPQQDESLDSPPTHLVIGFDGELDASLLTSNAVRLEGLSNAHVPGPSIPIDLSTAVGNPQVLLISPRVPLPAGSYRITLATGSGTGLADVRAHTLANEFVLEFHVSHAP